MAELEEGKPLPYVSEIVLKKRKKNDEWAIKRRGKIETRRLKRKEDVQNRIKRPEDFVKEFRDKELDLVRMKNRLKVKKSHGIIPESQLLFVIRLPNSNSMHPKIKKILNHLRLRRVFTGVFLKASQSVLDMLLKIEPYVTYGYPNLKSVRELVFKKGCGMVSKQSTPLTDNVIIEKALGKYGIICIEDIVHEIASVGLHFFEVTKFLMPFRLKKPDGKILQNKRCPFKDGGDAGNRQELVNELISKIN